MVNIKIQIGKSHSKSLNIDACKVVDARKYALVARILKKEKPAET